jgi:hypothetical protein
MPRKPNYGLNKHRKEQDRKAKKDAKLRERQQRREERTSQTGDDIPAEPDRTDTSPPPGNEGQ